jgi:hypothetical protein
MQLGDPNGIYRRALAAFPDQAMVKRYMDKVTKTNLMITCCLFLFILLHIPVAFVLDVEFRPEFFC